MNALQKIWQSTVRYKATIFIILAFVIGFLLRGGNGNDPAIAPMFEMTDEHASHSETADETIWTCSMHPQIRQQEPGQCPICGMDLIPVTLESAGSTAHSGELKLSETAMKLSGITTAPVERKFVTRDITMSGKVSYDETRLSYITAWVPGRIDRLYVDYTGIPVRAGDHLADIYSPQLLTAQEELFQALKAADELKNSSLTTAVDTANSTVNAAREKLRLLGLTREQIDEFENRRTPSDHVTIYSTQGGIVIHKDATEGMYVNTGTRIFTIADLSQVWVKLDVYESDLAWIRYGQDVDFYTEAYPGETFTGKIAFIDPILNDRSRTIKVRVNIPNSDRKLKPDMFVRAMVHSTAALGGKVMDPSLAGKYICPMHPEIVKDGHGTCDICEMELATAESLGYGNPKTDTAPLVIPATAPLITGERAVVYVAVPGSEGTFEGKEIVLGPRAGDYYLVYDGLVEGESVVVNGNFKIDSAVQILAGPSMMNPTGKIVTVAANNHDHSDMTDGMMEMDMDMEMDIADKEMSGDMTMTTYDVPDEFIEQLSDVYQGYFHTQFGLSHDDAKNAGQGAEHIINALENVDMMLLEGDAHMAWMKELNIQKTNAGIIAESVDIEQSRAAFWPLSESLIRTAKIFGVTGNIKMYVFHCPMAFDNTGANWVQNKIELENPYFGSSMLTCGELIETLAE